MKKQLFLLIVTIVCFFAIILVVLGDGLGEKTVNAVQGQADFSGNNLNDFNNLNGEWELYDGKLIQSHELGTNSPQYTTLPQIESMGGPTYHYVSYRMVLQNFPQDVDVVVGLDGNMDGYAIYLNGTLAFTNHQLQDENGLIPLGDVDLSYHNLESELEIIIEISNPKFGFIGLDKAPYITAATPYANGLMLNGALKAVIIGVLIFIALYQFIVVGLRSHETGAIYFSLMAITGAIQVAFYHNRYNFFFGSVLYIPDEITVYIHQLAIHLVIFFFFLILESLYHPKGRHKFNPIEQILFILPLVFILISVVIPYYLYSAYMNIFKVFSLINVGLIVAYTFINQKKQPFGLFLVIASASLFLVYGYDLLSDANVIRYTEEISSGVYIMFTIIYSSILAFMRESEISSVEQIIELNKKIRDTEFTFLNSQIQSHFIYNSLNSIQALINTNPEKAAELVEDFSTYLRTRLEFNKMPQLLNIEDELENIRTYLNIEKARFGKRVNYVYNLKVGDFMIPPLSVQPLVENAVKHGISMKKNGGTITISTYDDENYIYIKVADDGVGFDPDTLSDKQRVGTENIRNRLSLNLNATLTINSQVNVGTESIIKIPKKVPAYQKK